MRAIPDIRKEIRSRLRQMSSSMKAKQSESKNRSLVQEKGQIELSLVYNPCCYDSVIIYVIFPSIASLFFEILRIFLLLTNLCLSL